MLQKTGEQNLSLLNNDPKIFKMATSKTKTKKTASGHVDRRTKEGKAIAARVAKAQRTMKRNQTLLKKKINTTTVKKNADGTVDKRTKEGKAIIARMAKARRALKRKNK